jgi:Ca-activated chloride channel homolog
MNMRRLGILLFISQIMLDAGYATALSTPQDREASAIKTDVALVPLYVSVRDKAGDLIDNLRQEDFTVYDNGIAQKIAIFSHEEVSLDVALVLDSSNSMASVVSERQDAALRVIQHLNLKNDRVALFCFHRHETFQLTDLTQDRFLLQNRIGKIPIMGSTSIKDALWAAARFLRSKDPGRRRAIILISDNQENKSSHTTEETLDEMLEAGVILYNIRTPGYENWGHEGVGPEGFFRKLHPEIPFEDRLQTNEARLWQAIILKELSLLAAKTGGEVLDMKPASLFYNAMNAAILRLKHSYTLGFYPSDKGKEGSYHRLKIKLPSQMDYSVQAREGYYVLGTSDSTAAKTVRAPMGSNNIATLNSEGLSLDPKPLDPRIINRILQIANGDMDEYDRLSFGFTRFEYSAAVKSATVSNGKKNATIDIEIDTTQLFFRFAGGRYKGVVLAAILQPNKEQAEIRSYALNFPEEGFRKALQSKVSFSITVSPPKNGKIRIVIFQPDSNFFGDQSVQIQP